MPSRFSNPLRSSVYLFIRLSVLLSSTFLLGFLTGRLLPRPTVTPSLTVTYIVDGDTVDLSDGRRLRLRGIDAPEGAKGKKTECLGAEAKNRLTQLVLNQTVALTEVPLPKDSFGRTLAVINLKAAQGEASQSTSRNPALETLKRWLGLGAGRVSSDRPEVPIPTISLQQESRGTLRGEPEPPTNDPAQVLVAEGLARAAGPFPSADYQEKLFTLEEEAKDQKRGLWDENNCPTPTPVPPSCNIKGNVHWKKRQKLYFPSACPGYARIVIDPRNGDRWFCTVAEAAEAGFTLSSTCSSTP